MSAHTLAELERQLDRWISERPDWDRSWLGEDASDLSSFPSLGDARHYVAWITGLGATMRSRAHATAQIESEREARRTVRRGGKLRIRDSRTELDRITIDHYPPSGRSRCIPSGGSGRGWFSTPFAGAA